MGTHVRVNRMENDLLPFVPWVFAVLAVAIPSILFSSVWLALAGAAVIAAFGIAHRIRARLVDQQGAGLGLASSGSPKPARWDSRDEKGGPAK